ncbi:MAG: hypothetical protein MUQ56_14205 [Thermoleophilia bacterium]|nr:hypothetical protein [Thermoleophilia bacterium]
MTGLYDRIAGLPLNIEGHRLGLLQQAVSSGFNRVTTVVTLHGGGFEGVGEDITNEEEAHAAALPERSAYALAGAHSFAGLSELLQDLLPAEDVPHPRWGFEAAALDLALRQAGLSFGQALDRPSRPVRFVMSTRLASSSSVALLREWVAVVPGLEFKLDPQSAWTPELFSSLRSLGRVRVLDLKGSYKGTSVDQPFDADLYRRVGELASAYDPPAYIEDPALDDGALAALDEGVKLVSWDAPIHSVADIEGLPFPPAAINIKPSRFGSVERLVAAVEYCEEHGIPMYGGGQFELGPGRDQIQVLASVFYADAANDVAPSEYNVGEPRAGMPVSPLAAPAVAPTGFRFAG